MSRWIAHLDADCFYASAERVRRPHLRDVPLGVLGNQGACVIAKSYEMKASGVKTGEPIWDSVKKCPRGVYIKRDFKWYDVLSQRMLEVVRQYSPVVEYYSVDEFFFELDRADTSYARSIQQQILDEVGVPVTIGVSCSRALAKLTSDLGKPFGCCVLADEGEIASHLESIPVDEVTGIAGRSALKLAAHGIKTCGDFRRAERALVNRLLTKKGEALWWELHGQAVTPIQTRRPMHKAIGRGGSIGLATDDPEILTGWLVRNLERLVEALDANGYVASRLMVSIEYKRHGCWGERTTLPQATSSSEVLLPAARFLFNKRPRHIVSHIHLLADRLEYAERRQLTFADLPRRIDSLKQLVNNRLGRWTLRSAETLALGEIYHDPAHAYEICDIQGKTCF